MTPGTSFEEIIRGTVSAGLVQQAIGLVDVHAGDRGRTCREVCTTKSPGASDGIT